MVYKQQRTQKPVTFLSHENFLVYQSQPVTPGKHGNSHFNTLSAINKKQFIHVRAFVQVNMYELNEFRWWRCGESKSCTVIYTPMFALLDACVLHRVRTTCHISVT